MKPLKLTVLSYKERRPSARLAGMWWRITPLMLELVTIGVNSQLHIAPAAVVPQKRALSAK